ncbi:aspartate kinase [Pedobacter sp. SL55]|uniref:aspartate kinase n=1 Tax=Pedobacter sp. SL55 TaxID=2995161 RepID=UPI00226F9BBC|nr:aspartate kinase [Pedobacter sp. SL55]WAC40015.1 aspartate kinase [Pedobacter sp. SL55]
MQVYKFGGASIKNIEGIKNVTQIIQSFGAKNLLVVVSAMNKTTDKLQELAFAHINGDEKKHQILESIKDFHFEIIGKLFADTKNPIYNDVANTFVEIEWLLEEDAEDSADYLYDQIVSIGELVSSKIIAAYLNQQGTLCVWQDARNYIQTDNNYREANVQWDKTTNEIQKHLPSYLDKGIVLTQGFIGNTSENFTSTLGREGSDYSAAIFSAALDAEKMTIWKDVPGVLNADPKWFDETEKIPQLSYRDAIELTYYGATVIHPKTIKPIQNKGIPLYVRSFIHPEQLGTEISSEATTLPVPSFIFKVNQVLLSISPKDFSFIIEENLSHIFAIFHQNKVKVNTMLNSAISFSVSIDNDEQKIESLINDLSADFKVKYNKDMELVTIRYYNQQTIDRVTENKKVWLEVKSRNTCQMVMKNL